LIRQVSARGTFDAVKIVPVIKCSDLAGSIAFYTRTLDFVLADPGDAGPVIEVVHGDAELQLSTMSGDGMFGCAINVWVDDVDALFQKYLARGLDTSNREDSPVHQGPIDQTWGTREFYATDPDGNTLRFRQPIR
jgi:catechol 2,3-dioxygenase-like lactoylglutathione lyase family enzyme